MAHIRTHKDGRPNKYEVVWSQYRGGTNDDGTPRRRFYSESFRTKEQAEAFKRRKEDQAATNSLHLNPEGGRLTIGEWAEMWIRDYRRTVKPSTAAKCRGLLDASVLPEFKHVPVKELSTADVQAWLRKIEQTRPGRQGKPISPPTIRHHYLVLRSLLRYAAQNGAIMTSPAESISLPTYKSRDLAAPEPHFLDAAEAVALASQFPYPYDLLIEFLAFTGLRVAEAAGLNIEDIHFDKRDSVRVLRTRTKIKGGWREGVTKNGKGRWAPLHGPLQARMREYIENRPNNDPASPLWPGSQIIRTRDGSVSGLDWEKCWNPGVFYRRTFKPTVTATPGVPDGLRLHDLRHSFASICASQGIPAAQIADWMGHGSEVVTLTIYTHLFKQDTDKHGDALASAYAAASRRSDNVVPMATRNIRR